jgi:hypothetical protein
MPQARLSGAFYSYTIDDNTALSEEQYEACVRRCGGKDSIDFRREYLNEQIRDENTSICPPFHRHLHVVRDLNRPTEGHYSIVIDWGGVRDKTVALVCVYDFERDKLLVLAERPFAANTPTSSIIEELKPLEAAYRVTDRIADCPGQLSVDLAGMNYEIRAPIKADWSAGVNALQVAFSLNKIEIDASCELLITTLESGQYNSKRTDFARSAALGHCDAAASMLYAWRSVRRDNPFQITYQAGHNKFSRSSPEDPITNLARMIQPKTFGSLRNR